MVSNTLFVTSGMPRELVLDHLRKVQEDRTVSSIHIVGYDFGSDRGRRSTGMIDISKANEVANALMNMLHFDSRQWKTIKLAHCRGKMVHRIVEAIIASNVQRFILSATPNTTRSTLITTSTGLALPSSCLLTLSINDIRLDHSLMNMLCSGLSRNKSIVELSFINSRFTEDDSSHLILANTFRQIASLQHLSFSNCRLEDEQCHDLVLSLMGMEKLLELNLDGNQCQALGLQALSILLTENPLLVLDLSSQKVTSGSMDLTRLAPGLAASKLRCLQLSGNTFDSESMKCLSAAIGENASLKIVHLAWSHLNENAMLQLGNAMRRNTSIEKLVFHGCSIDNQGLSRFANRMRQMKGLRRLDLGGTQAFDSIGLFSVVAALQRNTEIEEIIMPVANMDKIYTEEARQIMFLCDANRGGRRFLRFKERSPVAIWPLILSKIPSIETPHMMDGLELASILSPPLMLMDQDDDDDRMSIDGEDEECCEVPKYLMDEGAMRRVSVLYHLLRNGPLLQL